MMKALETFWTMIIFYHLHEEKLSDFYIMSMYIQYQYFEYLCKFYKYPWQLVFLPPW